jgi:hypothetical protein
MQNRLDHFKKELGSLIRSEKQVIYILSEVRKIIESKESLGKKYSTLRMYCNWVLHTVLSKKEVINFIKTIDFDSEESLRKIALETFKEELKGFLIENNLPTGITEDEWFQFRKNFLSIIHDIPLKNKNAKDSEIKEFCLRIPFGEIMENSRFLYRATYGNGEIYEMGVLLGDYDPMTKRKEDREMRSFWRRINLKKLHIRMKQAENLGDEEKARINEENEIFYKKMKKEEEEDDKEAKDDLNSDFISGGTGWMGY